MRDHGHQHDRSWRSRVTDRDWRRISLLEDVEHSSIFLYRNLCSCLYNKMPSEGDAVRSESEASSSLTSVKAAKAGKESKTKPHPSTLHGTDYQLKITLWILLNAKRIINESIDTNCSVTAEDPLGGKFDDTVLRLRLPDGRKQALYIQAKHKNGTANRITIADLLAPSDKAFSLTKYYQSFRILHRKGMADDAKFVVCTNAGISKDVAQVLEVHSSRSDILAVFHRVGGEIYKFDIQQLRCIEPFKSFLPKMTIDNDTLELLDLFFDQFLLVSSMEGDFIKKDISKLCGSLNVPSSLLFTQQMGLIEQSFAVDHLSSVAWSMTKCSKTKSQADIEQICDTIARNLCYLHLKGATSSFCENYKNSDIRIKPTILEKSKAYMACMAGGLHKHYTVRHAVSCIAIYQIVQLVGCEYIFTDNNAFLNLGDIMKDIFSFIECHLVLVVVCKKDTEVISTNSEELLKHTVNGFRKTVILITSELEQNEGEDFFVSDLTDQAMREIFKKYSHAQLSGTYISLENLVSESDNLIFLDGLIQAIETENGKTCPSVDSFEKIKACYISRTWKMVDTMDCPNNVWPSESFNGVNDLAYSLRKLDEPMGFREIVAHLKLPSHVLNTDSNDQITLDYIDYISQHPPPGMDTSDRVHIFLDDAGFGKTTYMTWLAWYFAVHRQSCWTIRLNAIEYSYDFEQIMKDHGATFDTNEAVRILFQLIQLVGCTPNLIRRSIEETNSQRRNLKQWAECLSLLEGKITVIDAKNASIEQQIALRVFREKFNEKQIVLLLDGFDEIAPHYKNVVLKLFSHFAQFEGIHKLYFTSRPYNFIDELKAAFQVTTIYRLEPFTCWDQYDILHNYLACHMSGYGSLIDIQRMHLFEILLEILRNVLGELRFIPLFFRMALDLLTEVLKEHIVLANNSISHCLFKELQALCGRLRILESLVNKKLALANLEKSGSSNTASFIVHRQLDTERLNDSKRSDLALLGIYTIFPSECQLLSKREQNQCKKYLQDIAEGREKSGIVEGVQAGVPLFIHRMFAEYFAACWLFESRDRHEVKLFLKSRSYWENRNVIVRRLFDEIAIRDENGIDSKAHLAVMDYDENKLMKEIELDNMIHQKRDAIGRTPLHLAVQHFAYARDQILDTVQIYVERIYPPGFVNLLVEKMEKTNISLLIDAKDDLLQWNALDYAFRISNEQAIEYLLSKNASINEQTLLEQLLDCEQAASNERLVRYDKYVMGYTQDIDNHKPLWEHSAKQIASMRKVCDVAVTQMKNNRIEWFEANKTHVLSMCAKMDAVLLLQSLLKYLKASEASEIELNSTASQTKIVYEALKHHSFHVLGFLIRKCKIDMPDTIEDEELYMILVIIAVKKYGKWFTIFLDLYYSKLVNSGRMHWNARESRIMDLLFHVIAYGSLQMVQYFVNTVRITIDVDFMFVFINVVARIQDQHNLAITLPYVFDRDVNISGCDDEGRNLLQLSAALGQFTLLEYLIARKQFDPMRVNARNG
ncbi:uncharacterized protein LOC118458298 isoform X1 [Anopheles albimanus]|uniref:uncharacterized protein LOC118458298 isoform X1 n=1 Tax=Anopheles albimanus TaxID=7167 RepID=UPI001641AD9F|nr:uncharacterized protein LOC118458298 isoform X1 [Anopheles albimanus]